LTVIEASSLPVEPGGHQEGIFQSFGESAAAIRTRKWNTTRPGDDRAVSTKPLKTKDLGKQYCPADLMQWRIHGLRNINQKTAPLERQHTFKFRFRNNSEKP
jgi:hypothetical protein